MTLLFVANLGQAWGAVGAPAVTGQVPAASRYRAGYRTRYVHGLLWLLLFWRG